MVFHPLFLVFILVYLGYSIDIYAYLITDEKEAGLLLIMAFALLVLFPLVAILIMNGLNMISGISMPLREDRIGPLIITLTFYIWFFININDSAHYPDTMRFVALGATLSIGAAFFINNFSKISLHTVGASSFFVGLTFLFINNGKGFVDINLWNLAGFRLSAIFVLLISLVIAGAIGSARLYLKAHSAQEVYGGYLIGSVAQIIAFRIMIN